MMGRKKQWMADAVAKNCDDGRKTATRKRGESVLKRGALLNTHLMSQPLVASIGHLDEITIADAGLPVPSGVTVIDLAVSPGIARNSHRRGQCFETLRLGTTRLGIGY